MSLFHMSFSRLPVLGGLAVAAVLLLAVSPASAQAPAGKSKLWPWNVQGVPNVVAAAPRVAPVPAAVPSRYAVTTSTPFSGALEVVVTRPAPAPVYVDLRGPDGQVRSFRVEGGSRAIQSQSVIVHAGERLTIGVGATAQAPREGR